MPAMPILPMSAPAAKRDAPKAEQPAPSEAQVALNEVNDAYKTATAEFFQPWRDAQAKGEKFQLDYTKHPDRTYGAKFAAVATQFPATDVALEAWVMALRTGADAKQATEAIMRDHVESRGMDKAVRALASMENADELLLAIIEKNPHREVKGFTMLQRAEMLKRKTSPEAEAVFEQANKEYGDVSIYNGRFTVGGRATSSLFEMRNLAIGKTAPDIEGEDVDGVNFKLSDYRGKVVLIDFWGDW